MPLMKYHEGEMGSKLGKTTQCGITNVSFGLIYHSCDLHHINENRGDTLDSYYKILNLHKIQIYDYGHISIILWHFDEFMC